MSPALLLTLVATAVAGAGAEPLAAQQPADTAAAPRDTVGAPGPDAAHDTAEAAPDTARAASDTAGTAPDTAASAADSAGAASDSAGSVDRPAPVVARAGYEAGAGEDARTAVVPVSLRPPGPDAAVAAYAAELRWNPDKLSLREIRAGAFGETSTSGAENGRPGRAEVRSERAGEPADSTTTLLRAVFRPGPALSVADTAVVAIRFPELTGPEGERFPERLRPDTLLACLAGRNRGDVDGDGRVTTYDAVQVLKREIGMPARDDARFDRADLDGDGTADTADVGRMLRRAVGLADTARADSSAAASEAAQGADGDAGAGSPPGPLLGRCP